MYLQYVNILKCELKSESQIVPHLFFPPYKTTSKSKTEYCNLQPDYSTIQLKKDTNIVKYFQC